MGRIVSTQDPKPIQVAQDLNGIIPSEEPIQKQTADATTKAQRIFSRTRGGGITRVPQKYYPGEKQKRYHRNVVSASIPKKDHVRSNIPIRSSSCQKIHAHSNPCYCPICHSYPTSNRNRVSRSMYSVCRTKED